MVPRDLLAPAFFPPVPLLWRSSLLLPAPCDMNRSQLGRAHVPSKLVPRTSRHVARHLRCASSQAPASQTVDGLADQKLLPLEIYDVIVIGGGPAGLSLAAGLGRRSLRVLCCDPALNQPWPNNYGTWLDELAPLGLDDCVSHVWDKCAAYICPDSMRKTVLHRGYARVDRVKLKQRLLDICYKCTNGNVTIIDSAAAEVTTPATNPAVSIVSFRLDTERLGSHDTLAPPHPSVTGRVVVDATGHRLKFVQLTPGSPPGYQAAYGIECTVSEKSHEPIADRDEMTLMDFRDDHMQSTSADRIASSTDPTFLYVMPLDNGKGRRVFFEETSLVASPAMPFDELKRRLELRLAHYGVAVEQVHDEEFCLIPMGGEIPVLRQRVIAFGGAAAHVHPATGYMIARALSLSGSCAEIIASELIGNKVDMGGGESDADAISHRIWGRLWNVGRRRQRDFFNFGGEYLQSINLAMMRELLTAFFALPLDQWSGFLSFKLLQPYDRLKFGLSVFARTTNEARLSIVPASVLHGGIKLAVSVMPFYTVPNEDSEDYITAVRFVVPDVDAMAISSKHSAKPQQLP
jgi:lycopene beta-cyclase